MNIRHAHIFKDQIEGKTLHPAFQFGQSKGKKNMVQSECVFLKLSVANMPKTRAKWITNYITVHLLMS
jgi:hypothetical protein